MEEPKASRTVAEEAPFVIPGRPDPAMAFGMEQGAEEIPYEEETDTIPLFGADLESEPLPEETAEDVLPVQHETVVQTKDMDNIPEEMDVEICLLYTSMGYQDHAGTDRIFSFPVYTG